MKKIIPFVSPIVFGIFGGLLVECIMGILSITMSPFSSLEATPFLVFLCIASFFSALIIIVTAIFSVLYLPDQNNRRRIKATIIAEIFSSILFLLISWRLWSYILGELLPLF